MLEASVIRFFAGVIPMKKTLSKLIVALLRVSTDEQDTQRQRLAIERYAKQNGLVIARW